jgi:hypothetical protein
MASIAPSILYLMDGHFVGRMDAKWSDGNDRLVARLPD